MRSLWPRIRQGHVPDGAWTDYHENSKTTRHAFSAPRGDDDAKAWMNAIERRPFVDHDLVDLPAHRRLEASLGDVLQHRRSSRDLRHTRLSAELLSTLLHATYGITQTRDEKLELRTVPSAGAMYPLEVFVALGGGHELEPGLYGYVPHRPALHRSRGGDALEAVACCMVERDLVRNAAAVVLIAGVFDRTIYKYGERGYRFVLLEAGHAAQNLILACQATGLGALPYGGMVDREVDALLGVDGLQISCVYAIVVGRPALPRESEGGGPG